MTDLFEALDLAHAHASYLASDLAHARDLTHARDLARELASDIDRALALAKTRSRDLGDALDRTLDLIHPQGVDLARSFDRTLNLIRTLNLAHAQAQALDLAPTVDRVLDRALDIDHTLDLARDISHTIDGDGESDIARLADVVQRLFAAGRLLVNRPASAARTRRVGTARLAGRVADLATRVLPPQHRARYGEEYRSELYELAAAGITRRGQLTYAIRLLDRAWVLRAELREAVGRRART